MGVFFWETARPITAIRFPAGPVVQKHSKEFSESKLPFVNQQKV